MTGTSPSRHGVRQSRRFKLNATTIAIRSAFAVGLGLALASASPVMAGTCEENPPGHFVCDGDFGGSLIFGSVDDLTVVVGEELPSTVTGNDYLPGIAVYSDGSASLANAADVSSYQNHAIYASSFFGDTSIDNSGGLSAESANGIFAISFYGDVGIDNSGQIQANDGFGVVGVSRYGSLTLDNSGDITSVSAPVSGPATAVGVYAVGDLVTTVNNDGSIVAVAESLDSDATAYGVLAFGGWSGISLVANYGDITADAVAGTYGNATAIGAWSGGEVASVVNDGSIVATAEAFAGSASATGAQTYSLWGAIYSYGDISASALADYGLASATGIDSYGYFGTSVINEGDVSASAQAYAGVARAFGVNSLAGIYGAYVTNEGSISADAEADYGAALAVGSANIANFLGDAVTTNSGDISATADAYYGDATAFGVYNYSYAYGASIDNGGSIFAGASADFGTAQAVGAMTYGYVLGAASIVNSGDIIAEASAYAGQAVAQGASANAFYAGVAAIYNEGGISAEASADYGVASAVGANASAILYGAAAIFNDGSIEANASAYAGEARAYGAMTSGKYASLIVNDGDISASAEADYGQAIAIGAYSSSKYDAQLINGGDISASASAAQGAAIAYGAYLSAGYYDASVSNDGDISATASAEDGLAIAVGIVAVSDYGSVSVVNDGSISAHAEGYYGAAVGVFAAAGAYGEVVVANYGDIVATAEGDYVDAIGVQMSSSGTNVLINEGDISASGGYRNLAVLSNDAATAIIYNSGNITGSILTGDQDDYLYNDGAITLDSGYVDLGGYSNTGNVFDNTGIIEVNGDSAIYMGAGNPLAFNNDGVIDFLDGAANDTLSVFGDFSGDGNIWVDIDSQAGTSDVLYVEGNLTSDALITINGNLLAPITDLYSYVDVVVVSGDNSSNNFALGTISGGADSFINLDYSLLRSVVADDPGSNVLSIAVEVDGLSTRGNLATAILPGVQNLWHATVGTTTQRDGTLRDSQSGGHGLWLRAFSSGGDFALDSSSNFGAATTLGFEQDNSGIEAGFNFQLREGLNAGFLFGQADADVTPTLGGQARIDADTFGAYVTWQPTERFYLDASYRRMGYDIEATGSGSAISTNGDANGYSLEAGYRFSTQGGLIIEPQFQLSHLSVDGFQADASLGDLQVDNADSQRMRLGVSLRKTFETGQGNSWTPYATLSGVRESDGDSRYVINDSFVGVNSLDGNSTLFEAGANGRFGAWTVDGSVNWQDGGAIDGVFGGQINLRYTFGAAKN